MAEAKGEDELLALIRLTMVAGVGPLTSRALLAHFQSASRVLAASRAQLRDVAGVGPKLADKIGLAHRELDAEAELALCRRMDVRVLPHGDSEYPSTLLNIPDPPSLLYIKGQLEPRDQLAIAVVGSRHCTPYGARTAERLAASLARTGFTVVSGLARGIDAAAHRGAIKAGGRTVAVLANGLGSIYPPEHEDLARSVAEAGALVSEMPMRQSPLAGLFTQRNRIISGLSLGVVVVEATPRSGSLSTARHALEQNREVFAVPGPVDSLSSRGCHRLIRDGARLVENVDDILEELGPLVQAVEDQRDGATGPTSGRVDAQRRGTVTARPARRPSDRRGRPDRSHRPDRRSGHGHAQRPGNETPGPQTPRPPIRPGLTVNPFFNHGTHGKHGNKTLKKSKIRFII